MGAIKDIRWLYVEVYDPLCVEFADSIAYVFLALL